MKNWTIFMVLTTMLILMSDYLNIKFSYEFDALIALAFMLGNALEGIKNEN